MCKSNLLFEVVLSLAQLGPTCSNHLCQISHTKNYCLEQPHQIQNRFLFIFGAGGADDRSQRFM